MESDNFSPKIPEKAVGNTSQPSRTMHFGDEADTHEDMHKLARTARPERHLPRAIMRPDEGLGKQVMYSYVL